MIILDTNVISEGFRSRPEPSVIAWMETLVDEVSITAITLAELLAGVRRLPEGARKAALTAGIDTALDDYRQSAAILAFDDRAAERYADILTIRERAGLPISSADAQIAAICRVHGATLATRNTKDFEKTGVALVNPWSA
ncbi:type II toxin-antitoxin system VapC family toxin [Agromyces archimandritae]|uniref:Ribonuclease VapC n=1 Tax=Agromyces archimandritae TaxID=2781962 RepID=A0A975FLT8_9MICO|nr:type II toxin-antitoxin system VapC family toxin [Agromyces archimandritae]QTX04289.1 type II toxin-antitoxin system VapC family toxin [Agromyces archimandritae]